MEVMLVALTKFQTQPCQIIPITRRQVAGKLECFLIMAIPVMEFQVWGYKITKNDEYVQRKLSCLLKCYDGMVF